MDIIGLHLGMTAQEVKMVLQRHDVTMQIWQQNNGLVDSLVATLSNPAEMVRTTNTRLYQ